MGFVFGEDPAAVQENLKAAVGEGLQFEGSDALFELFENLLRQTDGMGLVPSLGAVFNFDPHRSAGIRDG